jgi:FGGY-family pentulose kinase
MKALVGIDVGTGSARAGVFGIDGHMLASARRPITIWHEAGEIVEQSSDQIWQAVCEAVREAVAASGLKPEAIAGIGFDATCSLVVVDATGGGVPVGPSEDPRRNVIVWMDHRANAEAEEINRGAYPVLDYVGGRISPEMETPKLLWLSRHRPDSFARAAHFFDLSDYLTWRATGSLDRSVCTVTCKWTYLAHENRWDPDYFRQTGLGTLADEGFRRIGTNVVAPGTPLGGLTERAAAEMGLAPATPVAAALIDAHAGGVGTLGVSAARQSADVGKRLAYIFGTSACSMASTPDPVFVPGVWGPYYTAMIPGIWLLEGGQSAAGAALLTRPCWKPKPQGRGGRYWPMSPPMPRRSGLPFPRRSLRRGTWLSCRNSTATARPSPIPERGPSFPACRSSAASRALPPSIWPG